MRVWFVMRVVFDNGAGLAYRAVGRSLKHMRQMWLVRASSWGQRENKPHLKAIHETRTRQTLSSAGTKAVTRVNARGVLS